MVVDGWFFLGGLASWFGQRSGGGGCLVCLMGLVGGRDGETDKRPKKKKRRRRVTAGEEKRKLPSSPTFLFFPCIIYRTKKQELGKVDKGKMEADDEEGIWSSHRWWAGVPSA